MQKKTGVHFYVCRRALPPAHLHTILYLLFGSVNAHVSVLRVCRVVLMRSKGHSCTLSQRTSAVYIRVACVHGRTSACASPLCVRSRCTCGVHAYARSQQCSIKWHAGVTAAVNQVLVKPSLSYVLVSRWSFFFFGNGGVTRAAR